MAAAAKTTLLRALLHAPRPPDFPNVPTAPMLAYRFVISNYDALFGVGCYTQPMIEELNAAFWFAPIQSPKLRSAVHVSGAVPSCQRSRPQAGVSPRRSADIKG